MFGAMIYFDMISVSVDAINPETKEIEHYGRVINLSDGLNIIAGDNTSGKTTLAKCFYYILGVEEIIDGKQNSIALDRSVFQSFSSQRDDGSEMIFQVASSYVLAQLRNSGDSIITIKRSIKEGERRDFSHVEVWECAANDITDHTPHTAYYMHYQDDHNSSLPFGYFQYLAKFAGLEIIKAPTKNGVEYDLYLKTLFALDFVEQTRGWTDYFATIRGYNFIQPKQRVIEYALGLNIDDSIATYKQLKNENDRLKEEWEKRVRDIKQRLTYNNLILRGISDDINKQKTEKELLQYGVIGKAGTLAEVMAEMSQEINILNSSIRKTDDERFEDYNKQLSEFKDKEKQYDQFYRKLQDDYRKKDEIARQLNSIQEEIDRNRNIKKVSNLLNSDHVRRCPTCHRELDISDGGSLDVSIDDLERNIRYLTTQKSFLEGLKESLVKAVEEKEIYLAYYKKIIRQEKETLKTAYSDVADLDKMPSERVMMKMTELKMKLGSYDTVSKQVQDMVNSMWPMKQLFDRNKELLSELAKRKDETENTLLNKLQGSFRNLLREFNYRSNNVLSVSLMFDDKNSNYLYLPIAQVTQYEEHLRSVSSASDFVRSVWAFYLSLLINGQRHPGFLVLDEPCQHSIREADLKKLFETCSNMRGQIILFCSSEPKTEETVDAEKNKGNAVKTNIESLVKDIDKTKYNLVQMRSGEKSIASLGN